MKFYTHKITLLERTKALEGFVCQSLTFTNKLGNNWSIGKPLKNSALTGYEVNGGSDLDSVREYFNNLYSTPLNDGATIEVISIDNVAIQVRELVRDDVIGGTVTISSTCYLQGTVDNTVISQTEDEETQNQTMTINELASLKYYVKIWHNWSDGTTGYNDEYIYTVYYIVNTVENRYPTKPWTITSAINRILDLAEPLFLGDTPRFVLNPVQAQKWEDAPLPNTTMTQCTLREQLQHIGNYVHGQARLGGYLTEDVTYNGITYNAGYYENMIFYDEYGQEQESTLQGKPYVYNQIRQSINEYNTQIDTTAQNIVNSLDYGDGVIVSPDAKNFKTVRTEGINVRLGDNESTIIATELPIYDVISVKCKAFERDGSAVEVDGVSEFDITPFVFERYAYNSVLQSYGGGYPYSKSYAIYYAQGEKNIKGLFFKPTTEASSIFGDYVANYSIVNILESVAPGYYWKGYISPTVGISNTPLLAFQVSYIPFYQTRYSHTNGYIIGQERKLPYTKIYNQSENVIETRFYGENIKGVAKRLGNQEATRTYILGSINNIPKVGTMLDGYYISQAVTEYMPFSIRCTVGLTKNFNRLSQNVGINSHKRVAEVSEREAYERNILIKEYICIGSNTELPLKASKCLSNVLSTMQMLRGNQDGEEITQNLTVALNTYANKNSNPISKVKTPIVSSAFGNAMTFSWSMKDNYSAGEEITKFDTGYWQRDVAYSDYYGRAYYLDSQLINSVPIDEELLGNSELDEALTVRYSANIGLNTPVKIPTFILRKDSREKININLAIEYISNRQDLILGSALASCNPIISNSKKDANGNIIKPKMYYFGEKINQYDTTIIGKTPVFTNSFTIGSSDVISVLTTTLQSLVDSNYQSWCIAYEPVQTTTIVYNEDTGENEEYTTYTGGEILIACNNSVDYYLENNIDMEILNIKPYSDKYKDYESA